MNLALNIFRGLMNKFIRVTVLFLVLPLLRLFSACGSGLDAQAILGSGAVGVTFSCGGEISLSLDSTCTIVDDDGNVVEGDIYIDGEFWDGSYVPCDLEGDGFLIEITEPSANLSKAREGSGVTGNVIASARAQEIRGSGNYITTARVSETDAITEEGGSVIATEECACTLFNVYTEVDNGASPNISMDAEVANERRQFDSDTTNVKIMGSFCDVDAKGVMTCEPGVQLVSGTFSDANVQLSGTTDNGMAEVTVTVPDSDTSEATLYTITTAMDGTTITLDESNKVSQSFNLVGIKDASELIVEGENLYTLMSTFVSGGRGGSNTYGLNFCTSGNRGESIVCEEIMTEWAIHPKFELREDGTTIITYIVNTDAGDPLDVAVGPDFQPVQIDSDVSNYDTFYKDGKLYIAWTEGESAYTDPLQTNLTIVDVNSETVLSTLQVTNLTSPYSRSGFPQVIVDSRNNIYVSYGIRHYHIIGTEGEGRDAIEIREPSTETGYFIDRIVDGTITNVHQIEGDGDGWTDEAVPQGSLGLVTLDRFVFRYTTFLNRWLMQTFGQ